MIPQLGTPNRSKTPWLGAIVVVVVEGKTTGVSNGKRIGALKLLCNVKCLYVPSPLGCAKTGVMLISRWRSGSGPSRSRPRRAGAPCIIYSVTTR